MILAWGSLGLLFDITVGIELFQVGPKVVDLLIVLDAGESHFRARDFGLRIFDVFLEGRLIPDDARILVGIAILVIRDATDGGWARGDVREESQSWSLTEQQQILCMGLMLILTSYLPRNSVTPGSVLVGGWQTTLQCLPRVMNGGYAI